MTDINVGQFSEALNDKMDRDLQNVDSTHGGDAVVAYQKPTSANGWKWYRKYASGWVEQGGVVTTHDDTTVTVNLPVTMANTNYYVNKCNLSTSSQLLSGISYKTFACATRTTTSFQTFANAQSAGGFMWEVKGMAAS